MWETIISQLFSILFFWIYSLTYLLFIFWFSDFSFFFFFLFLFFSFLFSFLLGYCEYFVSIYLPYRYSLRSTISSHLSQTVFSSIVLMLVVQICARFPGWVRYIIGHYIHNTHIYIHTCSRAQILHLHSYVVICWVVGSLSSTWVACSLRGKQADSCGCWNVLLIKSTLRCC